MRILVDVKVLLVLRKLNTRLFIDPVVDFFEGLPQKFLVQLPIAAVPCIDEVLQRDYTTSPLCARTSWPL